MSNRRDDLDRGFFCADAMCDGDHISANGVCSDEGCDGDDGCDMCTAPDFSWFHPADPYGDGIYDREIIALNND